ncbi:MAG: SDR family oxidoreductase [Kangiellaceae bacterium]|jgi:glucose 1-dehydrogenase|nr:SDR family oxidoreductase [Kangiellaceae bacterium]
MKKTALVTGGAIRVGKALVETCASLGYRLIIVYQSSDASAKELSRQLTQQQVEHCLVQCDLSDPRAFSRLFNRLSESNECRNLLPVDLLINSAAIFPDNDTLSQLDENWQPVMTINTHAPLSLIQQFAEQEFLADDAQVINIVDGRLNHTQTDRLVYRLSKQSLITATKDCAKLLAPAIRVNGIALGAILPPPGADDLYLARLAKSIPLRRTGDVEHVQRALTYLLSQSFVTGQIITLDGGEFL